MNKFKIAILALMGTAALTSWAVPKRSILSLKETITDTAIVYPESFETNTKEMMNNWYLQNYTVLDQNVENRATGDVSDEEYIKRLKAIPAVIEMPFNQVVKSCIERYITRNRTLVEQALGMSLYYMPIFEQALEKEQLPLELKYLPVVESALNPNAVSRVGASGLWQFMVNTAKGVGLEVNSLVDERRDPYKSSEKAASYLKSLYNIYNDWSLAIAAYNCGPNNVNKALRRASTPDGVKKDFWQIYYYLPRETRSYVPAFIAANYVMTYFKRHNINASLAKKPLITDTVKVNRRVNFNQISEVLNIPIDEIRILNPQFRHDVIPGDTHPYSLILPSQQIYSYIMSEDSIVNHKANLYAHRDVVEPGDGSDVAVDDNSSAGGAVKYHKVQRGEKLSTIANRYGLTAAALKGLNGLKSNRVRTGTVLKVSAPEKVDTADTDNLVADNTDTANADATAASEVPATAATNSPYKGSYSIDSPAPTAAKSEQNKQVGDAFSRSAKHEATAKANEAAQPSKAAETSVKEAEAPNNTPVTNSKQWKARNDRYASKTTTAKASKESTYKNSRSSRTRAKAKPKTVPSSYTIQKGDNLIDIAKKSGVSVDELRKANGISGDKIKAGDKIAIPSKAKAKTYKSRKRRR